MNKKLAAALSGGAVLVLALSGCSGDEVEDEGKKTEAWAKTFCEQAKPSFQKRAGAQQTIISTAADSKPADVQAADSKAFQDIADSNKALAKAVQNAGVPPVENGEKLQQDAVKELNSSATAYEGLRKQVDALDTKSQQKFADGLKGVADSLKRIEKMDQDALAKLQTGDLRQAMARQPGCQKVRPSAVPTTTSGPAAKPGGSASPSAGASAKPAESAESAKPSASASGASE